MKFKITKRQLERIRILYAIQSALKYGTLNPKDIFETGVNPEYMRRYDAMNYKNPKDFLTNWNIEELNLFGKTELGHLKIRKTKKGYIIYMDLVRISNTKRLIK